MRLFKPDLALVQEVVQASPAFAWEMQARGLAKQPEKKVAIDWEQAKGVLGEQIVGRIVMLARNTACREPGSRILFLDSSGTINADWDRSFFAYLHVPRKARAAQEIRGLLAANLVSWVKKHPQDAKEIGLSADRKRQLHLLCRRLEPVLDPIADS